MTDLDDAELVAPQPGRNIGASECGPDPLCDGAQKPATDVASERFVDRLEAADVNDQNGRAFGRKVWIRQQLREPFVTSNGCRVW